MIVQTDASVWITASGVMIGASDVFEHVVAAAISLFGLNSGVALATVVGVPVAIPNRNQQLFPA